MKFRLIYNCGHTQDGRIFEKVSYGERLLTAHIYKDCPDCRAAQTDTYVDTTGRSALTESDNQGGSSAMLGLDLIEATYYSVWDGDQVIAIDCSIDLYTGVVKANKASDEEPNEVNSLDREYVEFGEMEFAVECGDDGNYRIVDLQGLTERAFHRPI